MAELIGGILAVALTVLALVVGAFSILAHRRFGGRRFLVLGGAFLLLAAMGALSFLSEQFALWDESLAVEPTPLAFLLVFVVLVVFAVAPGRDEHRSVGHG